MGFDRKTSEIGDFVFDKRLYVIFLIIFTEIIGFSMVLPIIPYLGKDLGLTPIQIGLVVSIFSICQLFASPITGKLSDHFGRKPLLILSQLSTLIGFILLGFTTTTIILIAARVIDGLLGSNMTVSQAYISDITLPKHRTRVYGYSSGVFGAGLIIGPTIGGVLLQINYSVPMFFAAALTLVTIALIFFLPETINKKTEKISLSFNDIIPIKEVKRFTKKSKTRNILLLFFVYSIAFFLFINNFPLFAETHLHVTADQVSFYMAWIGIIRVAIQTILIAFLLRTLGENRLLVTGIISMIISMVTIASSIEYFIVFIPLIFLAYGTGVSRPILTSKLANCVTHEETATILGINNSLTSLSQIIAPIIGGLMIQYLPSQTLPILSAIIFALALLYVKKALY